MGADGGKQEWALAWPGSPSGQGHCRAASRYLRALGKKTLEALFNSRESPSRDISIAGSLHILVIEFRKVLSLTQSLLSIELVGGVKQNLHRDICTKRTYKIIVT